MQAAAAFGLLTGLGVALSRCSSHCGTAQTSAPATPHMPTMRPNASRDPPRTVDSGRVLDGEVKDVVQGG